MGRQETTKRKPHTPRIRRTTLSPSIVNHIIDKIVDAFYKITNNNSSEAAFLKEHGYNPEKYFDLTDKRRKIDQDIPILLHEVITDINTLHESRKDFYISKSKYFVDQLAEIRKNSSLYAINEIKRNYKDIFTINKLKHGIFKAKKYTKQHFSKVNLNEKFDEMVNDNIEKSNYNIIEQMIEELRKEYALEVYFFQCCLNKLYKKYHTVYPREFAEYDKKFMSFIE
jgi:hypothetical protein